MKLSLNWLKDYVDPKVSVDELVHRLTMAGLEVESVHSVGKDTVLDLEITPNRPDCLNTLGLAREISAICGKDLEAPKIKPFKAPKKQSFSISVEDKKDCARYIGTLLTNVKVGNTSSHMAERIQALGLRSISNAVDITNFVLMELGQPLHVFDFDKIEGGRIIVRRAHKNETIVTLDGIERKLDPSILVIADAKKAIAIAGIMGGMDTQVTADTKNILLESAQFDLGIVRRGSRALGLKSDSSYRFERGVDIYGVLAGADRASNLLVELCGGTCAGRVDTAANLKANTKTLTVSIQEINDLLGTKVSAPAVKKGLLRLGLGVAAAKKDAFKITVPSFRGDLKQNVDVIEEVARIIGYDNLDVSLPTIQVANIVTDVRPRKIKRIISDALVAQGFHETITFSLINQKDLDKTGLSELPILPLQNALSAQHNILRPSLLPSLLQVAATNFSRGQKDLKIFEIGKRYLKEGEQPTLGILCMGRRSHDWRTNSKESVDFYDVKGVIQSVLASVGVNVSFETANFYKAIDQSAGAAIMLNGKRIGTVGKIEQSVLLEWDIKAKAVFYAGLHLEHLFALQPGTIKYQPISEFPGIGRDISLALKNDIYYEAIKAKCLSLGQGLLTQVNLMEEYKGDKIEAGQRALVLSLLYQSKERTLREEEVNSVHQNIVTTLTRDFAATMR